MPCTKPFPDRLLLVNVCHRRCPINQPKNGMCELAVSERNKKNTVSHQMLEDKNLLQFPTFLSNQPPETPLHPLPATNHHLDFCPCENELHYPFPIEPYLPMYISIN